jgi:hypothetical protein
MKLSGTIILGGLKTGRGGSETPSDHSEQEEIEETTNPGIGGEGGGVAGIIELFSEVGSKPTGPSGLKEDTKETTAKYQTEHEQDECLQIKSDENSERTFETILKLKRVHGSFIRNPCSLHLLGESAANHITSFSRFHELSAEVVFQLFMLKK